MNHSHVDYYISNSSYSEFLETQQLELFSYYIESIRSQLEVAEKFLDVGCGTGIVVNELALKGIEAYGIEVSESSYQIAKTKLGKFAVYDGKKIPYDDNSFDAVGSFNVIEHVEDAIGFLDESLRVLKPGGRLIICSPNFLSVTTSYHPHMQGVLRKLKNVLLIFEKLIRYSFGIPIRRFDSMVAIQKESFTPDDDAITVTNCIDFMRWARLRGRRVIRVEGSITVSDGIKRALSLLPLTKYFMGGCFLIIEK